MERMKNRRGDGETRRHGDAVDTQVVHAVKAHRVSRRNFLALNIPVSPLLRVSPSPRRFFILHPSSFILSRERSRAYRFYTRRFCCSFRVLRATPITEAER